MSHDAPLALTAELQEQRGRPSHPPPYKRMLHDVPLALTAELKEERGRPSHPRRTRRGSSCFSRAESRDLQAPTVTK